MLGDQIFDILNNARSALFLQGEMAELAYSAYNQMVNVIRAEQNERISVTYAVGFNADKTPINSTREYTKQELFDRYVYLANEKLASDSIFKLVNIIETTFNQLLWAVLRKYPKKISDKKRR